MPDLPRGVTPPSENVNRPQAVRRGIDHARAAKREVDAQLAAARDVFEDDTTNPTARQFAERQATELANRSQELGRMIEQDRQLLAAARDAFPDDEDE